jgi:hypothetical protein
MDVTRTLVVPVDGRGDDRSVWWALVLPPEERLMRKIVKRAGIAIAATMAAAAVAAPGAGAATTVVGSTTLPAGGSFAGLCGTATCTVLQTGSSTPTTWVATAPVDGQVTSWSFRSPSAGSTPANTAYSLVVARRSGAQFVGVGASSPFTLAAIGADAIQGPFTTAIAIKQGDLIGFRAVVGSGSPGIPVKGSVSSADTYAVFNSDLTAGGIGPQTPAFSASGQQLLAQATIQFTTPPPGCPPNCPPPAPLPKPSLTALSASPTTFRAASRGGSFARARRRVIPIGTKISYRLSQAATTTFTLERAVTGRRVNRLCVAPKRSNRTKPRCTRYLKVSGSFSRAGQAGANSFKFSGRLRGSKLSPGSYRLTGVASNANGQSNPVTTTFTIVK